MKINPPPAFFWFRRKPLLTVATFVFAGALGAYRLSATISASSMTALLLAITAFGLWHWYDAAEIARNDKQKKKREAVIDELLEERRSFPLRGRDLTQLSADALRIEALAMAAKMRSFENERQVDPTTGPLWSLSSHAHRALPEAARSELWNQENNRMISMCRKRDEDYRVDLWPDVLPLWNELTRRVPGHRSDYSKPALDHGLLAGAHPLEEGAYEIEVLASKLVSDDNDE